MSDTDPTTPTWLPYLNMGLLIFTILGLLTLTILVVFFPNVLTSGSKTCSTSNVCLVTTACQEHVADLNHAPHVVDGVHLKVGDTVAVQGHGVCRVDAPGTWIPVHNTDSQQNPLILAQYGQKQGKSLFSMNLQQDLSPVQTPIKSKGIPQTLHFVYGLWDTKPMDQRFRTIIDTWARKHPTYEVKIWNRNMCEELLQQPQYQHLWTLYQGFTRRVMAADLLRIVILLEEGGYYLDLDCVPGDHTDLSQLSEGAGLVLFTEINMSLEHAQQVGREEPIRRGQAEDHGNRVSNYAMGSRRNHPFWQAVLKLLQKRCQENPDIKRDYDVLFCTGPDLVTTVWKRTHYDDVKVLDKTEADAVLSHKCFSSWREGRDI